jgi:hypothetical protein
VVYLRDEPGIGRVLKWHDDSLSILTVLVFLGAAPLFIFYMSCHILVQKNQQ